MCERERHREREKRESKSEGLMRQERESVNGVEFFFLSIFFLSRFSPSLSLTHKPFFFFFRIGSPGEKEQENTFRRHADLRQGPLRCLEDPKALANARHEVVLGVEPKEKKRYDPGVVENDRRR